MRFFKAHLILPMGPILKIFISDFDLTGVQLSLSSFLILPTMGIQYRPDSVKKKKTRTIRF